MAQMEQKNFLAGSYNFQVKEIEVYIRVDKDEKIEKKTLL